MTFVLHASHSYQSFGLTGGLGPFVMKPSNELGLIVDLSSPRRARLNEPDLLYWARGLPPSPANQFHVFAMLGGELVFLGLASIEESSESRALLRLPEAVPDALARTLTTASLVRAAPVRPSSTRGLLAIVSKAVFEREAKRDGKMSALGDVLAIDRYVSRGPALAPLRDGATLVLVTVRPPAETIWLVAILEDLSLEDDGYVAKRRNDVPLTDVTEIVTAAFGSTKSPLVRGRIAMSLQTPRVLSERTLLELRALGPTRAEAPRVEQAPRHASTAFANPTSLPPILVSPPWQSRKLPRVSARAKNHRAALETREVRIVFDEHERVLALGEIRARDWHNCREIRSAADLLVENSPQRASLRSLLLLPLEEARTAARTTPPSAFLVDHAYLRPLVARLDEAALPLLLGFARDVNRGDGAFRAIAHVGSPLLVPIVLQTMARVPSLRRASRRWLLRFPDLAAQALIPLAAGVSTEALGLARYCSQTSESLRPWAIRALGLIADDERVQKAVETSELAEDARAALAVHPLAGKTPPAEVPFHAELPRATKDGLPLDDSAMTNLLTLLALTDWDAPTEDVLDLARTLDLVPLLDALVGDWLATRAHAQRRWTLDAACQLADGVLLPKVGALIRSWRAMYRFSSPNAVRTIGRAAIAQAGTPAGRKACIELGSLSLRAGAKERIAAANEALTEIVEVLDLDQDVIEELRLPHLGLERDGTMRLAFGEQRLVAKLDAALVPYLVDEATSQRVADVPRGVRRGMRAIESDAEREAERFMTLRKEARELAPALEARVERWMTARYRWAPEAFRERVLTHPILRDLARGLVWGAYAGTLRQTFRVTEDGTFADEADSAFALSTGDGIGILHPAEVDPVLLQAWAQIHSDYEIIPLFGQLATPVLRLTEEERAATVIARHRGRTLGYEEAGKLYAWSEERLADAPCPTLVKRVQRHVDDAPLRAILLLDPMAGGRRAIREVRVLPWEALGFEGWLPWSVVHPVCVSELLRDFERATS